jgi:predicted RNA-binding protein with PUA-like domain
MGYWLFKANPKKYDLEGRLTHPEEQITWQTNQHRAEMQIGDTAFVYRTGADAGIVATLLLQEMPAELSDTEFEREFFTWTR